MTLLNLKIGCAGWSLPRSSWPAFPPEGSHLERYAARFNAAEINSSFYRPHQAATYARWADSVPAGFSFAAKLPKTITHEKRLVGCAALLDSFLAQVTGLGDKLGCLLIQLPPSFAFDPPTVSPFLRGLRKRLAVRSHSRPGMQAGSHRQQIRSWVSLASAGYSPIR